MSCFIDDSTWSMNSSEKIIRIWILEEKVKMRMTLMYFLKNQVKIVTHVLDENNLAT